MCASSPTIPEIQSNNYVNEENYVEENYTAI